MWERRSMDLYKQRRTWRMILFIIALGIVMFSVIYTYNMAKQIEIQEKNKVEEVAAAYKDLVTSTEEAMIAKALETIQGNDYIPVIWASEKGEVFDFKNIDSSFVIGQPEKVQKLLHKLQIDQQWVQVNIIEGDTQYLYYEASDLLKKVRIYPYLLLALVLLFLLLAYLAFSFSRNAEQNQLWVGMAKETAHQLGTPLSSMSAWMDILEDKLTDEEGVMIRNELIKDISRLEIVAERFSKIGSSPTLEKVHAAEILQKCVDYISKRASVKVEFYITDLTQGNDICMISPPLFEWVIENLLKNALDAMDGVGTIGILAMRKDQQLIIEVHDTGKGIPKNKFNAVFEPGFTTKKRGWGLGLTLTRRIIEHYHQGKIFVKDSVPGKGTTFRIELKAGS